MKRSVVSHGVILALVGGLLFTGYGWGVASKADAQGNPFGVILDKLNEIVTILTNRTNDLQGVTQNWDKVLSGPERFTILSSFDNLAVRDNETGLVWEKLPSESRSEDWVQAEARCLNKIIANRKGWRLPSAVELASLLDTSQSPTMLPLGHPFASVGPEKTSYWTATTYERNTTWAWSVSFGASAGGAVNPTCCNDPPPVVVPA